jgi:hypothetical protein
LIECRLERVHLKEVSQSRDDDGSFFHSVQERKELAVIVKDLGNRIKVMQKDKKNMEAVVQLKTQLYKAAKAELDGYRKKRGKKGLVRIRIEKALTAYGISRPPFHGGDLTGVKIQLLLQSIDEIFAEMKLIVMDVEDRSADDDEVNKMFEMYAHLGFILDGIYSLARTKCGQLDDDKVALIKRMISAALHLWRCLRLSMRGPKVHGLEDHLVDQMVRYNGIGDFCEDFVEQAHQIGVRDELRTRNLTRSKAFRSHSKWEWMSNQVSVQQAKGEMKKITTRKRKRSSQVEEHRKERKLSRDEKRLGSLLAVENGNYDIIVDFRKKNIIINNDNNNT